MSYTRRAFALAANPKAEISLADIPATAPYRGPGPLYVWSDDSQAWLTWIDEVFARAHREGAQRAQREEEERALQNLQFADPGSPSAV